MDYASHKKHHTAKAHKRLSGAGYACGGRSVGGAVGGYASGGWIKGAIKHPGALHRELHVPEGEKIPAAKLAKAAHSENPKLRRRAVLAKTLKKMN